MSSEQRPYELDPSEEEVKIAERARAEEEERKGEEEEEKRLDLHT